MFVTVRLEEVWLYMVWKYLTHIVFFSYYFYVHIMYLHVRYDLALILLRAELVASHCTKCLVHLHLYNLMFLECYLQIVRRLSHDIYITGGPILIPMCTTFDHHSWGDVILYSALST